MAKEEMLRELAWIEREGSRLAHGQDVPFRWLWLFRVGVFICKCVAR